MTQITGLGAVLGYLTTMAKAEITETTWHLDSTFRSVSMAEYTEQVPPLPRGIIGKYGAVAPRRRQSHRCPRIGNGK